MRLIPRSLFGRLVLVLLTGLVLAQFLSAFVLLRDRGEVLFEAVRANLIERTSGIVRLMDALGTAERRRLLSLLSSPELRISLADRPLPVPETSAESRIAAEIVERQLSQRLPQGTELQVSLDGASMDPQPPPMHRRHMMGGGRMAGPWAYLHGPHAMARSFDIQVRLRDGGWLRFQHGIPAQVFDWPLRLMTVLGILLLSVVGLSLVAVRSIVRPLRALRRAAEAG